MLTKGNVNNINIDFKKELIVKIIIIMFALLFFLHMLQIFSYPWQASYTLLSDSDCYMHLLRVTKLEATHDWYDSYIDWSNAPYGEELHWTRAFDLILWLGALIGEPHVGFFRALHWWGVILSPVLGVLSFFSMLWVSAPYMKNLFYLDYHFYNNNQHLLSFSFWKIYLFLFFMGMASFWDYSSLARPDHHSLLFLLFILLLGFLLRMIEKQEYKYCAWTGLIAALAVWVSIESLALVALINLSILLLWICKPYIQDELHNLATKACSCSMWLFIGSVLAILIERPLTRFAVAEYDKISIVHMYAFLLLYIFWMVLSYRPIRTIRWKSISILVVAVAGVLGMYAVYPNFFKGPFVSVDSYIDKLWLSNVSEVQPLIRGFSRYNLAVIISFIGMAIFVFPYIIYEFLIVRKRLRFYWVVILVGIFIYFSLSLYQVRWSPYCEIIMILPMMFICNKLTSLPIFKIRRIWLSQAVRIGLVGLIALLPLYLPPMMSSGFKKDISDIRSLDFLRQMRQKQAPQIILTYIDFGPEIMYFTSNYVIATPYHRNSDGIMFLYKVMTAETDAEAYELLEQRKVDMIALYPGTHEKKLYLNTTKEDTFYKRFLSGAYPAWLNPIEVPENLQGRCYLFKVLR